MDPIYYIYIAVGAAFVGLVTMLTIKIAKKIKRKKQEAAIEKEKSEKNLEIIDDVRYTVETNPVDAETGDVNVTHLQNDLILNQNTPVTVEATGKVKPGKYILVSTDANISAFNIRVGTTLYHIPPNAINFCVTLSVRGIALRRQFFIQTSTRSCITFA